MKQTLTLLYYSPQYFMHLIHIDTLIGSTIGIISNETLNFFQDSDCLLGKSDPICQVVFSPRNQKDLLWNIILTVQQL